MKLFCLSLAIIISSMSAWAQSSVVSVDLTSCNGAAHRFFSGHVINVDTKTYVISSSRAQLSRTSPLSGCEVVSSAQGRLKVRALATDHLSGMSLFLVEESLPTSSSNSSAGGAVLHFADGKSVKTVSGNILLQQSRRHSLVSIETALEWKSTTGDVPANVLGAPLFLNGTWQGLVSHQYMEQPKGRPLQVSAWNLKARDLHDHLIVIPKDFVLRWVNAQIAKPSEPVIWPSDKQLQGDVVWIAGGYYFSADCPVNPDSRESHYPIGGHDGIGIGGGSLQKSSCKILTAKSSLNSPWALTDFTNWRDLSSDSNTEVVYSIHRDSYGVLKAASFKSLEDFFKQTLRGTDKNWIETTPQTNSSDSLHVAAGNLREEILKCASVLYIQDAELYELIQKLYVLSWASTSVSFPYIQSNDIDQVMDRNGSYKNGWRYLEWEGSCLNKVRPAADMWSHVILKKWGR